MTERKPKICMVDSSNIDLISKVPCLPKVGETLVSRSSHMGYGGKGANQAVMAAKLADRGPKTVILYKECVT